MMNQTFNVVDVPEPAEVAAYQDRFNVAFVEFSKWYQTMEEKRYQSFSSDANVKVTHETGREYIRIVVSRYSSRSSACFVRIADGAVMKCAGWKAPFFSKAGTAMRKAKQLATDPMTVRGSIFDLANLNPSRWA